MICPTEFGKFSGAECDYIAFRHKGYLYITGVNVFDELL